MQLIVVGALAAKRTSRGRTSVPAAKYSLARSRTRVGTLTCDVSAGGGVVLFQKQDLKCEFRPSGGGPVSYYTGHIVDRARPSVPGSLGSNVRVGGTGRDFSLLPLSVQGQVGVNVAAGITSVTSTAVR